ncbi:chorion class B protein Ld10-like [Nymphalis io]|uniref:chorion class B protein Ld10-like n=1 Tax=Inachis io TaxID=171585 RepID=UPI002167CB0A|nr:chorion class B protein Ld10-like [Nymphalis io]
MYKAVLLVCALALMIQSIAGACIGAGLAGAPFGVGPIGLAEPFGLAGPLGLAEPFGFAGPYGIGEPFGLAGPYGAHGTYGLGYGAGPFRTGYGYGTLI